MWQQTRLFSAIAGLAFMGCSSAAWAQPSYADLAAQSAALSVEQRLEARRLFATGFELWQGGDCSAATLAFGQGLKLDPANPQANYYHGDCLLKLRRRDEATEAFRRSSALGAGSTEGFKAQAALESLAKPRTFQELGDDEIRPQLLGTWEVAQRCSWGSTTDSFRIDSIDADGRASIKEWGLRGTLEEFVFSGKRVNFTFAIQVLFSTNIVKFAGQVTSLTQMSGTFRQTTNAETCNWTARKLD